MKQNILKYFTFSLVAIIIGVLAAATIVEKLNDTAFVTSEIYGAWWFVALWCILALSIMVYAFVQKAYKNIPLFLLYMSFIIILIGGFVTYSFGQRGFMHLRQNEMVNYFVNIEGTARVFMPFDVKMLYFDIAHDPTTNQPVDYRSFVKVDDRIYQISMNHIFMKNGYRIFQMSYDSDEMGAAFIVSHDPWGVGITYSGYLLLAAAMLWLLFLKIGWKWLLGLAVPVAVTWYYISQINPMTPILRTPMLAAHVSVIMVSYAMLLFIAITALVGLCSPKQTKRFYHLNSTLLYPAMFLLVAGVCIGAVWANISWGRYWGWDAKETWALITIFAYSLPMHKKILPFFNNPRHFHWFCLLSFLVVLMTFLGVSFLLNGMHSYLQN